MINCVNAQDNGGRGVVVGIQVGAFDSISRGGTRFVETMDAQVVNVISGLLKTQHAEILGDLERLKGQLAGPFNRNRVHGVRRVLQVLDQRVILHLAQEDNILYPHLLGHPSPEVRDMAALLIAEMGNLGADFVDYVQRWSTDEALVKHWDRFVKESLGLVVRLVWRINQEESKLFPLVDACKQNK